MEAQATDNMLRTWRIVLKSGTVLEFKAHWNKPASCGGRGAIELWQDWERFRATSVDVPEDFSGYSFFIDKTLVAQLCVSFREVAAILQIYERS